MVKTNNIKRIALTLVLAFVLAVGFFVFQFFVEQKSLSTAVIGAGIIFVISISMPIWFFGADKMIEKRDRKNKDIEDKNDKI